MTDEKETEGDARHIRFDVEMGEEEEIVLEDDDELSFVPLVRRLRRHLIVLDMNGLLIDRRREPQKDAAGAHIPPDLQTGCDFY